MCSNITTSQSVELSQLLIENINNEDTFNQLLFNGANINIQNEIGWCILFESISLNLNHKIRGFLEYGVNINIRDAKSRNALFWSVYFDNFDATKILLSLNSDLIVSSKYDLHLFHYAVYKNNLPLVKYLVENGMILKQKIVWSQLH